MRKRSRYKPRPMLANPVAYVLESVGPLAQHADHLIELKVKNHAAMLALTQGQAARPEMDVLIAMGNVTEALTRMGFGDAFTEVARAGQQALLAVCRRGAATCHFALRYEERVALNELLDLHDAQMSVITVGELDKALAMIAKERRAGRMEKIRAAA